MEVKGKGGWLGFFIFQLFAIPILTIGLESSNLYALQREGFGITNNLIESYLFSIFFAGCPLFYAGYVLAKGTNKKDAVDALKYMWGGFALIIIIPMIYLYNHFPDIRGLTGNALMAGFRSIFWGGIWTLYIFNSKRVRNTYPESLNSKHKFSQFTSSENSSNSQVLPGNLREGEIAESSTTNSQTIEAGNSSNVEQSVQATEGLKFTMFHANSDGRWYWVLGRQSSELIIARSFGYQNRSLCLADIQQMRAGAGASQVWDKTSNEFVP